MNSEILFYIIITIISINFLKDKILDALNAKHFNDDIPSELSDVFDEDAYKKSQDYKAANYKFGIWSSLFSLLLTLGFLFFDGFLKLIPLGHFTINNVVIFIIYFGINFGI